MYYNNNNNNMTDEEILICEMYNNENNMTNEEVEIAHIKSEWKSFQTRHINEENMMDTENKQWRLHRIWNIEVMKYKIKEINIHKKFLHLKIRDSLLLIALNEADDKIKKMEKNIYFLEHIVDNIWNPFFTLRILIYDLIFCLNTF